MKHFFLACAIGIYFFNGSVFAAGNVPVGTTMLNDSGSSNNPALWFLDGDYTAPTTATFSIGGPSASYNYLSVGSTQTFTASSGITMGSSWSSGNRLDVSGGGNVDVSGNLLVGPGSIMYYTNNHEILVSGRGSRVEVTGNLDMSNGYNATGSVLRITDGGLVVVDSDRDGAGVFSLYSHWSYGNCWLDLDDGMLAIFGDSANDFAPSATNMLASIRVWVDTTSSYQATADYDGSGPAVLNDYYQMLDVNYVDSNETANLLGLDEELVGFTVVRSALEPVPEPSAMILFILGGFLFRRKKR